MSIRTFVRRLFAGSAPAASGPRPTVFQSRLSLESLDGRIVPAALPKAPPAMLPAWVQVGVLSAAEQIKLAIMAKETIQELNELFSKAGTMRPTVFRAALSEITDSFDFHLSNLPVPLPKLSVMFKETTQKLYELHGKATMKPTEFVAAVAKITGSFDLHLSKLSVPLPRPSVQLPQARAEGPSAGEKSSKVVPDANQKDGKPTSPTKLLDKAQEVKISEGVSGKPKK